MLLISRKVTQIRNSDHCYCTTLELVGKLPVIPSNCVKFFSISHRSASSLSQDRLSLIHHSPRVKNISAVNVRQLLRLLSGAWDINTVLQALLTPNLCGNFRGKWFTAFRAFRRNSVGHPKHVGCTGWCCSEACWGLLSSVSIFSLSDEKMNNLLWYNAVKSVESQTTFRRIISLHSSGSNVGWHSTNYI
jgi:hypothetical protein